MESFIWAIVGIVAVIAICQSIKARWIEARSIALARKIRQVEGFSSATFLTGVDGRGAVGLSDDAQSIALAGNRWVGVAVFEPRELLSCEVFIDGQSESRTDRGSQLGGAVIGGLLFGPAGAIIGGLSGTRRTSRKIASVQLRIEVDEPKNPLHDIILLNKEVGPKDKRLSSALTDARTWHANIAALIRKATLDNQLRNSHEKSNGSELASIADEIKKFAELKDRGLLTPLEFERLKEKLLLK